MTKKQKESLKNSISSESTEVLQKLHTLRQELKPLKKSCAYDDAEYAFLCDDYRMKEREIVQLQKRYEELQTALLRMKSAEFGLCEECDEEIEQERLQLSPNARICAACLRQRS